MCFFKKAIREKHQLQSVWGNFFGRTGFISVFRAGWQTDADKELWRCLSLYLFLQKGTVCESMCNSDVIQSDKWQWCFTTLWTHNGAQIITFIKVMEIFMWSYHLVLEMTQMSTRLGKPPTVFTVFYSDESASRLEGGPERPHEKPSCWSVELERLWLTRGIFLA